MVIVGTVKKSIDTVWPTWLRRKVFHLWLGGCRTLHRMRENSALRDGDAEPFQFAMNRGCAPQRIGGHSLDQSAEFCSGTRATSPPALRLREPGPEFAAPFALPTNDSVWLDIKQRGFPTRTTRCEERPQITDPRPLAAGASVFVEPLLSAFVTPRSRRQSPDVR